MLVRAFLRLAHDGHCAGDKKRAQIAVTLLGESLLLDLAAARIVLRHETDPRGQVAAVLEQLRVGDTGPERTGDHRTNRGDRLEPRTQLARLVLLAQYTVERSDLGTDRLQGPSGLHVPARAGAGHSRHGRSPPAQPARASLFPR